MPENIAERLVRLRLHLLAIGQHIPAAIQAEYEECTHLIDEALLAARSSQQQSVPSGLTPREGQILSLLRHGLSNQKIAAELGVTPGTVKTYLKSIYTKLGVQNRTQAALVLHGASMLPAQVEEAAPPQALRHTG
ncbi:MAG: hypothetical protein GC129_00165 [Proteobacteria bacterium]|nr:hypothetical protein [Pseudomonadota bacterium]